MSDADEVEFAAQLKSRQLVAMNFAYGNLAASTDHRPCREAFRKMARDIFGWTDESFDEWARTKTGWRQHAILRSV